MKKIFLTFLIFFPLLLAFIPVSTSAQNTGSGGDASTGNPGNLGVKFTIDNPFNFEGDLFDFVKFIVNEIVLKIGAVLCVLAFIYAGFLYVTAGGDPGQIKTAHTALLYASIGTAVLLGAWVIANAIRATINQIIS